MPLGYQNIVYTTRHTSTPYGDDKYNKTSVRKYYTNLPWNKRMFYYVMKYLCFVHSFPNIGIALFSYLKHSYLPRWIKTFQYY